MLTTVTTILGLMPMVLATNIDFFSRTITVGAPSTQWWRQLSTAVAFGLTFATLLTLVVTPSALMLKENLRAFRARRRQAKAAPADAERSEEHTSELQSLMRISYAAFCLKTKSHKHQTTNCSCV